jgi:hypothetical protein
MTPQLFSTHAFICYLSNSLIIHILTRWAAYLIKFPFDLSKKKQDGQPITNQRYKQNFIDLFSSMRFLTQCQ